MARGFVCAVTISAIQRAPNVEHFYQDIFGFFWFEEGYRRMLQTLPLDRPSVFVEIGSYQGKSTAFLGVEILNRGLPVTLHCVDSWETPNGQANGLAIHDAFERNTTGIAAALEERFVVHWSPSVAAAEDFPEASADVVWVDGDHSYEGVTADILAWWPKVKPGGWMGGDDFMMFPVAKAVCEQFAPNYILCHGWTTMPEPMPWPSWLVRKS